MDNVRSQLRLFYFTEKEIKDAAKKVNTGKKNKGKPKRDLRVYSIEELEDKNALGKFFDPKNRKENIDLLNSDIQKSKYFIQPYTAIAVPRKGKEPRPILSPHPRDRTVFTAVLNRIRPKLDFLQRDYNIFGSASHEKLKTIRKILLKIEELKKDSQYRCVLKVDIKDFFPSINKESLLKELCPLINDDFVFHIIKHSLYNKLNYVGQAKKYKYRFVEPDSNIGIPQGCAYSPLLANFYAKEIDEWLKLNGYNSFRYLDDLLIFTKDNKEAERVFRNIERIGKKLNLNFHPLNKSNNKSYTSSTKKTCEYLGIEITEEGLRIPDEKIVKYITSFKERFFNKETLRRLEKQKVFKYTEYYINGWRRYYSSTCPEHFAIVKEEINIQIKKYLGKKDYQEAIRGMNVKKLFL